jgi:hypothetical protein
MCPMETGGDVKEADRIDLDVQSVCIAAPATKQLYLVVRATCGCCGRSGAAAKAESCKEGGVEAGSEKCLVDGTDEEVMGEGTPGGFSEEGSAKVTRLGLEEPLEGSNWASWLTRGGGHANGRAAAERVGFRARQGEDDMGGVLEVREKLH